MSFEGATASWYQWRCGKPLFIIISVINNRQVYERERDSTASYLILSFELLKIKRCISRLRKVMLVNMCVILETEQKGLFGWQLHVENLDMTRIYVPCVI